MILKLVKARLGIQSNIRDEYLTKIIEAIEYEIKNTHGIAIDVAIPSHLMFIVDYVCYRYENNGEGFNIPRHLQWRLHNLIVGETKK